MILPDYDGGGIVNLMASIEAGLGGTPQGYPLLREPIPGNLASVEKVVLLAIDGLGYDYLSRKQGALREYLRGSLTSVCPATTASAVTSLLTGVAPQQHGFTGWFTWFREIGSVLAVLPFHSRFGGEPLSGVGFTPASLCGGTPLFERIQADAHVVTPDWIVDSVFNRAFQNGARAWPYRGVEGLFAGIEQAANAASGRALIYAYWPDFDSLAHPHGVASGEVTQLFEQLDAAFARFVRRLQGSGVTLIITADHGFIDSPPERTVLLEEHPALADTLILPLCGEQRFAYCYLHPGREQRFEEYVRNELGHCAELFASAELIQRGWFGRGTPFRELQERVGHYTLVMRENWKIKEWVLGEKRHQHIGVHGGVSREEMLVPLIVAEL
jgi:predicted AlkP superfamily pyrophosphatase or phosphodiesterase